MNPMLRPVAVVTITVGDLYQEIASVTHESIAAYCSRIGADFIVIDKSKCSTPHWSKFQIFDLLTKYRRIIYLDTDVIVRDDCPNLFEVVPETHMGMFDEAPFTGGRQQSMIEACRDHGYVLPDWNGQYFNTGVMVISRRHRDLFRKPKRESCNFYEQGYFNARLCSEKAWVHALKYSFNRMACMDQFTGEDRHAAFVIHYAGCPDPRLIPAIAKQDLRIWSEAKPDYKFKNHILINVQGGLGDQVSAEPAIRFAIQNVWKDDDVQIKTHFPDLFAHLSVPVFHHAQWKPRADTPYHVRTTLPGPETITWTVVSNLLCHTVDYCSISLLRRTLPLAARSIQLPAPRAEDLESAKAAIGVEDVRNLVLVHAGRHWENKTFPAKWWHEVVESIISDGHSVCLVGKNEDETRGVVDVGTVSGASSAVDLLTLREFVALLSEARCLVSNDSSPVHLAGAFQNRIVLIPTCKDPDHVLPYRLGGQYANAVAAYKRPMWDTFETSPTAVHGSSAEFVLSGTIEDYLPDPIDVARAVEGGSCGR